jgi:DNA polymerase (family X)
MRAFTSLPLVRQVLGAGDTRSSVITVSDVQIDLRVVAPESIGAALQKPASVQTARLLAAINNPHVDVIAHPTGRLLGKRPGYEIDLGAVLDALVRTGTAIEVSGQPERLDLDADAVRAAVNVGSCWC